MSSFRDIAVEFKNVVETYDLELLMNGKSVREKFEALRDVSFSMKKGESLAILGANGAGKSTMLRLMAGLLRPEQGEVKVHGRVGTLLDLGAGFHPELTGRDNLLMNASLYNFSREQLNAKYDEILRFADIGRFIDVPVRCYSQGMYVRLAFSLAIHVDPDILLIDECLAVGDEDFRLKSIDRVLELKEQGKTIVFVTHDPHLARQLCQRGIYLKNRTIDRDAPIDDILEMYFKPAQVDKAKFKYLGARIDEEEQERQKAIRTRQEEDHQRALKEEKRLREEVARWEENEKRWKEEVLRRKDRERRSREERERMDFLSFGKDLKVGIGVARVQLFYQGEELTCHDGARSAFFVNGTEYSSLFAMRRRRKISDTEVLCYLRWPQLKGVFQVWRFKRQDNGELHWTIAMRTRGVCVPENQRAELWIDSACSLIDEQVFGNKATAFSFASGGDLRFETLCEDQVAGIGTGERELGSLLFLTVPSGMPVQAKHSKGWQNFFDGKIYAARAEEKPRAPVLVRHQLGSAAGIRCDFQEGRAELFWKNRKFTAGLGLYTSMYSKGLWYDSAQAKWRITTSSEGRFSAEGFWPWIALSQSWELRLEDDRTLSWIVTMRVHQKMPLKMREAVLMLSDGYTHWMDRGEKKPFPVECTSDDVFRMCLLAAPADGKTQAAVCADTLPSVVFSPGQMPWHRLIVENSAHMFNTKARVFHCLRVHDDKESVMVPGEYDFFQGVVTIKEDQL